MVIRVDPFGLMSLSQFVCIIAPILCEANDLPGGGPRPNPDGYSGWGLGFGSGSGGKGIAITIRTLERKYFLSRLLAHYAPCNPGGICRGEINISTSQTGGTLTRFVYVDYLSFSAFGARACFVADVDPVSADICPPDPAP